MSKNHYIIGSGRESDIKINYPKISYAHCLVHESSDDFYFIEDLDSSNHTFINGIRIKMSRYSSADKLMLADKLIEFSWLQKEIKHLNNDYRKDFIELKEIYEQRESEINRVKSKYDKKNTLIRCILSLIPGIVGLILLKYSNAILSIVKPLLFTSSATLISFFLARKSNPKMEKEIIEVNKSFYLKYKCPKCNMKYLETKLYILEDDGKCTRCGARFV